MDDGPLSVCHLAAQEVVVGGRYYRQRCAWCDEVLVDVDAAMIAVPIGQDPTPAFWPVGGLIRREGAVTSVVTAEEIDGQAQSPIDACWSAYLAEPQDAEVPERG